jgi:acetyl-CoA synthetase
MTIPIPGQAGKVPALLRHEQEYPAPARVAKGAIQQDFRGEYRRSVEDPAGFWAEQAEQFLWAKKWSQVFRWDGGSCHEWFIGGKVNITVNALDRHAHSERRDKAAFIWLSETGCERRLSYGELFSRVCRFANGLKSLGVGKGDRVIIYMPLTLDAIISMLACARIGAIHSVVYAGMGAASLRSRIEDAQARLLIAGDVSYRRGKAIGLKGIVDEALACPSSIEKVVVSAREAPFQPGNEKEVSFEALLNCPEECPAEEMDAEDALFILYTSGTSGKPKGVVHVHGGYMVGTTYHLRNFFDAGQNDVFWCTSDIGWIVGHSYIVYAPLCAGITTLIREGAIDYLDPGAAWEVVEKYRVSNLFTSPTAIRMFMRYGETYPRKHDLRSLRMLACAGEPLTPEVWHWAQTHLCGDGKWGYCVDTWWQTEVGAPSIGTPCTLPFRPGKAGVALPGVVADVVADDGQPLMNGQGGRLVLRMPFPHMMRTVWGHPEWWEQEWRVISGCYNTGDVAIRDEDGYFTILGRADDVLNVAGFRIGTAELEALLASHPAVAESAAVGVPQGRGQMIKCFVQLRAGYSPSEALNRQVVEHVRAQLGPIAAAPVVEFVSGLPKTRSGKIMRRYLRSRELGADSGDLSTLDC